MNNHPPSTSATHGVHTVATAAAMEHIQLLVTQNTAETALGSSKILLKLLQNALLPVTDPSTNRRRLRLSNKTVQKHVVHVKGPLDILQLVGFQQDGSDFIVLRSQVEDSDASLQERELLNLTDGQENLIRACCVELQQTIDDLERGLAAKRITDSAPTPVKKKDYNSSTLSESEYKARLEKIAKMKAEKKKEKERALQIWKEDEADRKAREDRKSQLKMQQLQPGQDQQDAQNLGVTIKKAAENGDDAAPARLPKPFAPTKAEMFGQQQVLQAAAAARAKRAMEETAKPPAAAVDPEVAAERAKRAAAAAKRFGMEVDVDIPMEAAQASAQEEPAMDVEEKKIQSDTAKAASVPMESDEDQKPSAKPDPGYTTAAEMLATQDSKPAATTEIDNEAWKSFLAGTPLVASAEGIRETSCYKKEQQDDGAFNNSINLPPKCLKCIMAEIDSLKTDLPSGPNASIWIRFDEETPQFMRAMIAGPLPGPTPYSGGLFVFDIFIPPTYPNTPPKVQIVTTGGGTIRFGPNLYACGKVCLSLLGTWPGPKWNPKCSTLLQVLISIQGLILGVEHPFYLEPGHGGWEGKIKDGDFQSTGQTLTGATVKQEMGVPAQVVSYEDNIRYGTVKYAMIQALQAAMSTPSHANQWLQPFKDVIQAHFHQNRDAILQEVQMWVSDDMLGRDRTKLKTSEDGTLLIDVLEKSLVPKLQSLLGSVTMPIVEAKPAAVAGLKAPPSIATEASNPSKRSNTPTNETAPGNKEDAIANKRAKMQAAAENEDFVLAGKLQEEVTRLENLQASIKKAANDGDYIRAGRLQAQLKALTVEDEKDDSDDDQMAIAAPEAADQWQNESDEEEEEDDEANIVSDDEFDGPPGVAGMGGMGGMSHPPMGLGKNVFAPPGWKAKHMQSNKHHSWGSGGYTLSAAPASVTTKSDETAASNETPKKTKVVARDRLCRLRIRLPNDESIVEDFDIGENLSAVYECLMPLVEEKDGGSKKKKPAFGSAPSQPFQGTFAKPLSSAGFTLLLTRPKREFSLEMHGAMTLESLNLVPSASLTVMKCQDRGVMKRGELESRLGEAQGDAMDVEGLDYEALMELTERVGGAKPSGDSAFVSLTPEQLDANSNIFSPAEYLATLDSAESSDDDRRCPVCLGNYDVSDSTVSIRKLKKCGHHFHSACLETWLANKSSCPLCKCSICGDD